MTSAIEIAAFADDLLGTGRVPDYPNALNGLQVDTGTPVIGLAAAVDFSSRAIAGAQAVGANMLVVHHGAFWAGLEPLAGARYRLIHSLIANGIAVYSSHLPLDCHLTLGNNALLADELGLERKFPFGRFKEIFIGVAGESEMKTEQLIERLSVFSARYGGNVHHTPFTRGRDVGRWGLCTGAGADVDTIREAVGRGFQTLIVGEGPHWTAVAAEENDLTLIYAGHYATETLGVQALARTLAAKFRLPWDFIPTPTGT